MICPDCDYDNIPGADVCAKCGQPLTAFDVPVSELERSIASHPVTVLPAKEPLTVPAAATVRSAVQQMNQARIGCVLVEEEGRIVGIFTERDALNKIAPDRSNLDRPVSEFMTASPQTVSVNDTIAYALHAMSVNGYRHIPVADEEGRAVSIISARDILRLLAVRFADIREAD